MLNHVRRGLPHDDMVQTLHELYATIPFGIFKMLGCQQTQIEIHNFSMVLSNIPGNDSQSQNRYNIFWKYSKCQYFCNLIGSYQNQHCSTFLVDVVFKLKFTIRHFLRCLHNSYDDFSFPSHAHKHSVYYNRPNLIPFHLFQEDFCLVYSSMLTRIGWATRLVSALPFRPHTS